MPVPEKWKKIEQEKPCYSPCPPFYDFCNKLNWSSKECQECVKNYGLMDFIE